MGPPSNVLIHMVVQSPYYIYDLLYGDCTTDKPFCVRWPNTFKTPPVFSRRLICHITNLIAIHNFLWLHSHHTIYTVFAQMDAVATIILGLERCGVYSRAATKCGAVSIRANTVYMLNHRTIIPMHTTLCLATECACLSPAGLFSDALYTSLSPQRIFRNLLSLSLSLYIYMYMYIHIYNSVCVFVCSRFTPKLRQEWSPKSQEL